MSTKKDYLPTAEGPFDGWQENFSNKLIPNLDKWNIPGTEADALNKLRTPYEEAYALAKKEMRPTRTSEQVAAKNETTKNYKGGIRGFVNRNLTYNDLVTAKDRVALGIPVRDSVRTPSGAPITIPDLFCTPENGCRIKVTAHQQPDSDGRSKRGKPEDAGSYEIAIWMGDNAPSNGEPCMDKRRFTRSPVLIELDYDDAGKKITFFARWMGKLGQPGRWSTPAVDVIPK